MEIRTNPQIAFGKKIPFSSPQEQANIVKALEEKSFLIQDSFILTGKDFSDAVKKMVGSQNQSASLSSFEEGLKKAIHEFKMKKLK